MAALIEIARRHKIAVLAGLFERTETGELYKAHVCVDETGLKAKYRKLHPFINPHHPSRWRILRVRYQGLESWNPDLL